MLTKKDIATLNRARATLKVLMKKDDSLNRLLYLGRFHESCNVAENAIFDVLNFASSYLDADVSDEEFYIKAP